jgi:hypothetical protein
MVADLLRRRVHALILGPAHERTRLPSISNWRDWRVCR